MTDEPTAPDDSAGEIDHYRVSKLDYEGGGWAPVQGFDKLDTPITAADFKRLKDDLEPGTYRLFGVADNLNRGVDCGWRISKQDRSDPRDTVMVTDTTAIVAREAVDHMIRYKDQYSHAMSVGALEDARDEIDSARDG